MKMMLRLSPMIKMDRWGKAEMTWRSSKIWSCPEFGSMRWNTTETRLSLRPDIFFIAHIVLVTIVGRFVLINATKTARWRIWKVWDWGRLLIESATEIIRLWFEQFRQCGSSWTYTKLWCRWRSVSMTFTVKKDVIGSLFGGLRECWFWFPLESV